MTTYIISDINILLSDETDDIVSGQKVEALDAQGLLTEKFHDKIFNIIATEFATGAAVPDGCHFIPLREYFFSHNAQAAARAARAKGLLNWRRDTVFCAKCGSRLTDDELLTARNCQSCGKKYFPRIEPAVIVLVSRGSEILLVKNRTGITDRFVCIAGFVENGESIEQTVAREVREEVGLEVKNVRYCASQFWPFPNQLMLGFRAEYAGGEIKIQADELADAQWFSREALPEIPKRGSLGYRLVMGEFEGCAGRQHEHFALQ